MTEFEQPPPRSNLLWLAIDLDGTLAESLWRPDNPTSKIGEPIPRNVAKLRRAVASGYKAIIHTARPWTDYEAIEWWCNENDIPFRRIQCGKILAALYIDDRGRHESAESWLPEDVEPSGLVELDDDITEEEAAALKAAFLDIDQQDLATVVSTWRRRTMYRRMLRD